MMMETRANKKVGWLSAEACHDDIILSSRIRLARNIKGYNFLAKVTPEHQAEIEQLLRDAILDVKLAEDMVYQTMDELVEQDRSVLVERHLISKELAFGKGSRGVAIGRRETLSIMVNEEDHLRMQLLRPGMDMESVWSEINEVDDVISERLAFAFHDKFGYLTACPTNVGTGLRVSVMLHLPAMVITRHIEKVFNMVGKLGLVVRGLYGEGTQSGGDLYQISNQGTLGKSEEDIIAGLKSVIPAIIDYERQIRKTMLNDARTEIEDQVWRAYGILTTARSISSEEALYLLSRLRLGINTEIIKEVDPGALNKLLVLTQPAHVQKHAGRKLEAEERNVVRAQLIRTTLGR